MRVLVACEESQVVCKAFRAKGHEAYSCDIIDCSGGRPEWHIKRNVLEILNDGWDGMIGHPPCTFLSYAGTRHWNDEGRCEKRLAALDFFRRLWEAPIERICLENPKGCASPTIAKYTQEVQPYYFGDSAIKTTWLWLKNLPPLKFEKVDTLFDERTSVDKPEAIYTLKTNGKKIHWTEANHGGKVRSVTFPGIANTMADQWG